MSCANLENHKITSQEAAA